MEMPPIGPLPPGMARLHESVRRLHWLHRFAVLNRVLLGLAFLPTGLVKLCGQRFTSLGTDDPVGFFFEAMYRTGIWWQFLGLCQMLAALLLWIPPTSTLGAALAFPQILSICLITIGVGFGGTWLVTSLMLLSCLFLLCWDADRIAAAMRPLLGSRPLPRIAMSRIEGVGWALGTLAGLAVLAAQRGIAPRAWLLPCLWIGVGAALLVVLGWFVGSVEGKRAPQA